MKVTDTRAVKQAIDIMAFIERYVKLKNGVGLCPFHQEKTASFHVNTKTLTWKCFGCGLSGDVIEFYQRIEGISFLSAVESLSAEAGISLQQQKAKHPQEARVLAIEAAMWFENWRRVLVDARNHLYDSGQDASVVEEIYDNHISTSPAEAIASYRRVRTPWLAAKLRAQYQEELDVLAECKACL